MADACLSCQTSVINTIQSGVEKKESIAIYYSARGTPCHPLPIVVLLSRCCLVYYYTSCIFNSALPGPLLLIQQPQNYPKARQETLSL